MHKNGNIALFQDNILKIWESRTKGKDCSLKTNRGNLLLICENDHYEFFKLRGKENPPHKFVVQDDGNLVIYDKENLAIWDSMIAVQKVLKVKYCYKLN